MKHDREPFRKGFTENTCHLILKHKWYDAIERGEKDKEYRKNTPYYQKRLLPENIRFVTLHRGYSSVTMTFEILKKEKTVYRKRDKYEVLVPHGPSQKQTLYP